jgi:putative membrane protein
MTFRKAIVVSSALLALTACNRGADTTTANTTDTTMTGTNVSDTTAMNDTAAASPTTSNASQTFVNVAAASDAFEIETSKLALANGASASVKAFATKMIAAHTESTAKLKTLTAGLTPALTPNPVLNAEQQQKVDSLKTLKGNAFDQAYIADQAAGHQQTLDALKGYAATGDTPELKTFATGLVPIVTAHLNMVKGLKA